MYRDVIGIVGGMGSYATANFFQRLLDAFPAEREWDRPRIIIDNRCTMPSRVRAILYGEKVDILVSELAESVRIMINAGATKIVLVCNTSHYFLPEIYNRVPEARGKIIDIIEETVNKVIKTSDEKEVALLASEGTIDSGIFSRKFKEKGILVLVPADDGYKKQRAIIESVKQHCVSEKEVKLLVELISGAGSNIVIIGCTEFPIVFKQIQQRNLLGGGGIL